MEVKLPLVYVKGPASDDPPRPPLFSPRPLLSEHTGEVPQGPAPIMRNRTTILLALPP